MTRSSNWFWRQQLTSFLTLRLLFHCATVVIFIMTAALQGPLHTSPQPTSSSVSPASSVAISLFHSSLPLLRLFKLPHLIIHSCHSCGSMKPSSTSPHPPQPAAPARLCIKQHRQFACTPDLHICTCMVLCESPVTYCF